MPESEFAVGCAGNLLVIPERSKHHDLSAKFIDYVLSDEVQNYLGNAGGIPVAADLDKITDEKSKDMIEEYDSYASKSKLSYYPDYAASSLTDAVPASFQELVNGTKDASAVLKDIHSKYDSGVEEMGFSDWSPPDGHESYGGVWFVPFPRPVITLDQPHPTRTAIHPSYHTHPRREQWQATPSTSITWRFHGFPVIGPRASFPI